MKRNTWTCEELEVKLDDMFEAVVDGEIEQVVTGTDEDGEPVRESVVTVTNVFPVVLVDGNEQYSPYPLPFLMIAWKNVLLEAIQEKAFSDYERAQEARRDR
jgi:hypothetical protein